MMLISKVGFCSFGVVRVRSVVFGQNFGTSSARSLGKIYEHNEERKKWPTDACTMRHARSPEPKFTVGNTVPRNLVRILEYYNKIRKPLR
jgi:hypothetical protein